MRLFSSRAKKGRIVLLVYIESGSVATAIALKRPNTPVDILMSKRQYILAEVSSHEQLAPFIFDHLRTALTTLIKEYSENALMRAHGPVTSLYVVVGAPWVESRSIVAEDEFPKEVTITETMIKNLAKKALNQPSVFLKSYIFESSVTRVQLNGYPTAKPVGKKAHHISVTVFQSQMPKEARLGIKSVVHDIFPGRFIDFRSSTRVALMALHESAKTNHYLYIAVGSASCECVSVHKEDANEHVTVPFGTSYVVRQLAGTNGLSESVFSRLRMLATDTCVSTECESLLTNLAKLEPELVRIFGDAFSKIAIRRKIPNVCFLTVQPELAPWFEHFFSRIDFAQFTVTAQPLQVSLLTPGNIHEPTSISNEIDIDLALAASFVNNSTN